MSFIRTWAKTSTTTGPKHSHHTKDCPGLSARVGSGRELRIEQDHWGFWLSQQSTSGYTVSLLRGHWLVGLNCSQEAPRQKRLPVFPDTESFNSDGGTSLIYRAHGKSGRLANPSREHCKVFSVTLFAVNLLRGHSDSAESLK